jgi:demethylmenaquinone methyltransferase/2-methoxy-6-polyprenyl-1,4-benzoquinol methylase
MDKKQKVQRIFDAISYRYDFLNHFLSAGIDLYWRKKALKLTKIDSSSILLDVACGTGDFAIAANKIGVKKIFGIDLSINMLKFFQKKSKLANGYIVQSIAEALPFISDSFTNITVAFGVRNFYNISEGFNSFYRVLKSGGKVTILEFRLPKNMIIKKIYSFYFNKILPLIGKLFSKDNEAYTYLPESVNEFDKQIELAGLLRQSGFKNIKKYSLTFGIVQVVVGEK